MFKDKINYKLINICLFALIIFLLYKTSGLWMDMVRVIMNLLAPFLLAFILAYALNPIVRFLKSKGIPKIVGIILIIVLIVAIIAALIIVFIPMLFNQLTSLFGEIITFIKHISVKYDINMANIEQTLMTTFNSILANMSKYISDGAINFVSVVLNYFTLFLVFISSSIYFLIDMDNIRKRIGKLIQKKNLKTYKLVRVIDDEMVKYFNSFFKIMFITLIEYTVCFLVIGHPNFILLGLLAAVASFIPYFGGMFVNVVAAVTAFVINFNLFIRTIILFFILSLIDGYVINPIVYGKSNKVPPLVTVFAVFAGGIIFGMLGIIISLPVAIIILAIYRFYKEENCDKITE